MNGIDWNKLLPPHVVFANEPMARRTTMRAGGGARWLLMPENVAQAAEILRICHENGIKPFFLGNGSNLLVRDEGYEGVVIATGNLPDLYREGVGTVVAEGGVLLPRLAAFAAEQGLSGLEFAGGIPGSVGGGVRMNAGAYGGEIAQRLVWVEYLDERGQLGRLKGEECAFGYRHSIFCQENWLVVRAGFALEQGDAAAIRATMAELNQKRREKQPLEYPSAGSTFKRPEGHFAAALIDQCGLKGLRVGDAQISEKHAGFLINRGNATAADILALMDQVRRRVRQETGVTLEPEIEILPKEV